MSDYLLMGEYGKERMKDLRGGHRRVKPWFRIGRVNRQNLFARLRTWWATRDEGAPKRHLERAR